MPDFLLEIGTEEIPARMIDAAREELARRVTDLLQRERLGDAPAVQSYSTPRRLAVLVSGVASAQPDVCEQVTGPSLRSLTRMERPLPPLRPSRARSTCLSMRWEKLLLPRANTSPQPCRRKAGRRPEILAEALPKEIAGIYWAKSMYWRGKSASVSCVRCAGWPRCLTGKWCRSNLPVSARAHHGRPPHPVVGALSIKAACGVCRDPGDWLGDRHRL